MPWRGFKIKGLDQGLIQRRAPVNDGSPFLTADVQPTNRASSLGQRVRRGLLRPHSQFFNVSMLTPSSPAKSFCVILLRERLSRSAVEIAG